MWVGPWVVVVTGGDVQFTSSLNMQVMFRSQAHRVTAVKLQLPMFVWLLHGMPEGGLDPVIEPVFYIDDAPGLSDMSDLYLLRGAMEAACEEAWAIYADLISRGIPETVVRQILPANLMGWGTVLLSDDSLRDFVAKHHTSSVKELALVAHGYERALSNED